MNYIESKYFSYCKQCRILRTCTSFGALKKYQLSHFMKNTTFNIIIVLTAMGIVGLTIASKIASSNFELLPILVSYAAVVVLAALTMSDYRTNTKGYSAR